MKPFRKRLIRSAIAITLAVATATTSAAVTAPIEAHAEDKFWYNESHELLDCINRFRTSSNTAWYRSKSGSKVYVNNLRKLSWSDTLEQYAIDRALIWGKYDRRGTKDPDDYLPDHWHYGEEILSWNSSSAQGAVNLWAHTDGKYKDQGNRRKMLSGNITQMGAACWIKPSNGQRYWVLVMSNPNNKKSQGKINGRNFSVSSSGSSSRSSSSSSGLLGRLGSLFGLKQDIRMELFGGSAADNGSIGEIQVIEMPTR